jgi:osmotically-inducible protein OsmY
MNKLVVLASALVGAGLLPIASYAVNDSATDQDTSKISAPDSSIASKIKVEMAAQHVASVGSIQVDSDASGTVWLKGYALSQSDIDKTLAIARSTEGVTMINNALTVKADE